MIDRIDLKYLYGLGQVERSQEEFLTRRVLNSEGMGEIGLW